MRKLLIFALVFGVLFFIVAYSYVTVSNGPITPLGRLSFVKIENPDMFPGHPHSELLADDAAKKGSACALVVHFAGSSNYRSYNQNVSSNISSNASVYIIEASYIDTQGIGSASLKQINMLDSLKVAIFGVPDGRYVYVSDGNIYPNYDDLMAHVNELALEHGQQGPIPMVWHGTVRTDNPNINPGCGFPFYFQILCKNYGIIPAYVYTVYGLIFPYLNDPYKDYELSNATILQNKYNNGTLNFNKSNVTSNTDKYILNNMSGYD